MGSREDDASPGRVIKFGPRAEAIEKVAKHFRENKKRREAAARQESASLQAGQTARAATMEIEELCAAVELTKDRTQHTELLECALRRALQALCALVSVRPIEDPIGWLGDVYGRDVEGDVGRAKGLREDEPRFARFLEVVCSQLSASGAGTLNLKHIVGDGVACVSPDEVSTPVGLADVIGEATSLLDRALEDLRARGSSVAAWNHVR